MERVEVQIGWWFILLMIGLGLVTAGVVSLFLWSTTRRWPRTLERDHLTLRNGTRIPWSECSNVVKQPMGRYDLVFGATTVLVPTRGLRRAKEIMAWIQRRLGTSL